MKQIVGIIAGQEDVGIEAGCLGARDGVGVRERAGRVGGAPLTGLAVLSSTCRQDHPTRPVEFHSLKLGMMQQQMSQGFNPGPLLIGHPHVDMKVVDHEYAPRA